MTFCMKTRLDWDWLTDFCVEYDLHVTADHVLSSCEVGTQSDGAI